MIEPGDLLHPLLVLVHGVTLISRASG